MVLVARDKQPESKARRTADLLVELLNAAGAEYAFGIPGVHSLALYESLLAVGGLQPITARHEQGAGFIAEGYARASGKPGILLTIGGPGSTNALTPLADAFADSVPVLCISAETPREYIGTHRGYLHSMRDQFGVFSSALGAAYRVTEPGQTVDAFVRAWKETVGPPPRPVFLEVPLDVLEDHAGMDSPVPATTVPVPPSLDGPVEEAADILEQARRPLLYVGGGANTPEAAPRIIALAEALQAPIMTTTKGKGAVPDDHPLHVGCSWAREVRRARWLREADAVLAVGTRLSRRTYDLFGALAFPPRLIHLDASPLTLDCPPESKVKLLGDVGQGLDRLLELVHVHDRGPDPRPEIAQFRREVDGSSRQRHPQVAFIMDAVSRSAGRAAITTHDLNSVSVWAAQYLPVFGPRQFLFAMEFGPLGFSLPGALGVKLARPEHPVLAFCGDGSFLFSLQELGTAVQQRLPVLTIVFNDHAYGSVQRFQLRRYGRTVGVDLGRVDFVSLAEAFGVRGLRCGTLDALPHFLEQLLADDGPSLLEVPVETDWFG